jgi:hypothetical protein
MIRTREDRRGEEDDELLGKFIEHLVSFLPWCFGSDRDVAEEVWHQATHLYGAFALRRGLAAGEVVEELHILREVLFRLLLEGPPGDWGDGQFQRELIALNRVLDQGAVRASVAYVDDLFFAHLQDSGIPEGVTPELEEEIHLELEAFLEELTGTEQPGPGPGVDDGER